MNLPEGLYECADLESDDVHCRLAAKAPALWARSNYKGSNIVGLQQL